MREERAGLGRRGATTVFVALSLAALLGMAALAVDMGMLLRARADAQRVADAAALAGAQEFMNSSSLGPNLDTARALAVEYAARNYMAAQMIDTNGVIYSDSGTVKLANAPEAFVEVISDSDKVRTFVRRPVRTWFAHYFKVWGVNFDSVEVSAKAAAQVVNAGTAKCVKPLAMSDMWNNVSGSDLNTNRLDDTNGSGIAPEDWKYNGDPYGRFNGNPGAPNTNGYGSSWRNNSGLTAPLAGDPVGSQYVNDFGRPVILNTQQQWNAQANPALTHNVTLPVDSANPQAYQGANPANPAAWQAWNIDHCNPAAIPLNASLPSTAAAPGPVDSAAMVDSTNAAIQRVIAQDPNACWVSTPDPGNPAFTTGAVKQLVGGSCTGDYPGWQNSPRVMVVPLHDPAQVQAGMGTIQFNNFAVVFVDGFDPTTSAIIGRLLYFAKTAGPLGTAPPGSLIKKLQLIE
jgi:Flp pilus assembly protein TadG